MVFCYLTSSLFVEIFTITVKFAFTIRVKISTWFWMSQITNSDFTMCLMTNVIFMSINTILTMLTVSKLVEDANNHYFQSLFTRVTLGKPLLNGALTVDNFLLQSR